MKGKRCPAYCGITCVNGQCPNALDELDRNSDTDTYASYHLEKKLSCNDCSYYPGCEDCYFDGTKDCVKRKDEKEGHDES